MRAPNVFTISPALPFLDTFVAALLAGEIVPGVSSDPLRLADTTIYVPTQRSARALGRTFLAQGGGISIILPRILPLGALEATETEPVFAEPDPIASGLPLPAAASPIWRRLRLAALIQSWSEAIKGALCSIDANGTPLIDDSEAFRVATSTVDAFALAGDLAGLIDEMAIEDVAWRELETLRMAGFDEYWRITTAFLSIATEMWPKTLRENGLVDPAARQIALADAQALALAEGKAGGPVIAIGSTGTNKATARLLAAIAHAPQGAVVLPGLDLDLDEAAWALIAGTIEPGQEPSFGHPQAAMARLLPTLHIARDNVRPVGMPDPDKVERVRFVAEALRPADTTDLWRAYRRKMSQKALAAALAGISLVEAADEREEALCLAIAMREALETPGRTAALVTPDRELGRRVRGELLRWNVEVFDTGGEPLAGRPLGLLARLVVAAAGTMSARDIMALLAHPLAAFDMDRASVGRLASLLEIGVLRVVALAGKSPDEIFALSRAAAAERHAHPAQKAIGAADWESLALLWQRMRAALAPLLALTGEQPLDRWVDAHAKALAMVADASAEDEMIALYDLFAELAPASPLAFDAESYGIFFGRLAGEVTLRNTERPHPRLAIYGLLEARLMQADLMLLAGLDDTIWPPQAASDAFLNRPMRAELGLSPPERRIGQTAHDFAQAMGNQTIILSRARKRQGSPCVPSRFLLRMEALGGRAWEGCRRRGASILALAKALDKPIIAPVAIARPRPQPPIALRPTRLSVTQIETLRRDPYSIYAAHILKLAPLPRVNAEIDPSTFGSLMHDALHAFTVSDAARASPGIRREMLMDIVRQAFATALRDPAFKAFRWPLIERAVNVFLTFDAKQRETTKDIRVEITGVLMLTLADCSTFTLSARADRIDYHRDGAATLIDYKTGTPPGNKEVQVGFAPQLTLEASILQHGGFGDSKADPIKAAYLKLGGKDGGWVREVTFNGETFADVVTRHHDSLHRLLSSFRDVKIGYPSRPFPKYARDYGDYDHLARVREWSLAVGEEDV